MVETPLSSGPKRASRDLSEGSGLLGTLTSLWRSVGRELWEPAPDASWFMRQLRSLAQLIALTVRGFQSDQLLLRASALTYVTALSVIPMLGVVIAILGLVGGDETIVNFAIEQLTTVAPEVRETVRSYAAGLDFSNFGAIGGAIVFGTAIFALRHLEETLNEIWGIAANRSWARRFADYLAVMVVGPISVGVAVSFGTALQRDPAVAAVLGDPLVAQIYDHGLSLVPVFVLFLGFTFLYWFFPNTTVRLRAAALGGLVAAVLFSVARAIYVDFQVGAATYQAVFGALSAVPLILMWLYACWAVVLLGAEVAFATQNLPFARREMRSGSSSPAQQEAIAVEIAVEIVRSFQNQSDPPNAEQLADVLDEPVRLVRRLIDLLEQAELLRGVLLQGDVDQGYLPSRPATDLTVGAVLRAVRGEVARGSSGTAVVGRPVAEALEALDQVWRDVADHTTLEALAQASKDTGLPTSA
jgi:membrane protein